MILRRPLKGKSGGREGGRDWVGRRTFPAASPDPPPGIRQKAPRRRPDVTWMRGGDSKRKSGPASDSHLSLPREGAVKVKERKSRGGQHRGALCRIPGTGEKETGPRKTGVLLSPGWWETRRLSPLLKRHVLAKRPEDPVWLRPLAPPAALPSGRGFPEKRTEAGLQADFLLFRFCSANTQAPLRGEGPRLPQRDALCQPGWVSPPTMGSLGCPPRTETGSSPRRKSETLPI